MYAPRITLDHWRALVAVVEAGGYAQAAKQIHKSQSTVSYAVQQIEERLGVTVFQIVGRKAVLTPAGRVLHRRGLALLDEAGRLERIATNLAKGQEAELRLSVEITFPTWLLLRCLERFAQEQPDTRVELYEPVLSGTDDLLTAGHVDLAVCGHVPAGLVGDPLMHVRFIAVAAPSHPLHRLGRKLTFQDLREHRHLIVRDTGTRRNLEGAWEVSQHRWILSHKATSIRAAVMGLGFAWYPEEIIREELEGGQLKPLPLTEGAERWGALYLVYADPDGAGPGTRRLGSMLREAAEHCRGVVSAPATSGSR